MLTALRVEAKKDKVHKVWTTLDGKIMYASDPESKNKKIMNFLFLNIKLLFNSSVLGECFVLSYVICRMHHMSHLSNFIPLN